MSEIFLKSNDLSLGYSNQIVIKGMNLNLFDEKNYQIIGKNGAGKTTLMNFISSNFDGTNFESKVDRLKISVNQISSTPTLIYDLTLEDLFLMRFVSNETPSESKKFNGSSIQNTDGFFISIIDNSTRRIIPLEKFFTFSSKYFFNKANFFTKKI